MKITIEGTKEEVIDIIVRLTDIDVVRANMPPPKIVLSELERPRSKGRGKA